MPTVAIVGSGLIGRSWAIVFARGGWDVRLSDPSPEAVRSITARVAAPGIGNVLPPLLLDLLAHRLARSGEQPVRRLERGVGGHHHIDSVRPVEDDPAVLRLDPGRLVVNFLIHSGLKSLGAPGGSGPRVNHPRRGSF